MNLSSIQGSLLSLGQKIGLLPSSLRSGPAALAVNAGPALDLSGGLPAVTVNVTAAKPAHTGSIAHRPNAAQQAGLAMQQPLDALPTQVRESFLEARRLAWSAKNERKPDQARQMALAAVAILNDCLAELPQDRVREIEFHLAATLGAELRPLLAGKAPAPAKPVRPASTTPAKADALDEVGSPVEGPEKEPDLTDAISGLIDIIEILKNLLPQDDDSGDVEAASAKAALAAGNKVRAIRHLTAQAAILNASAALNKVVAIAGSLPQPLKGLARASAAIRGQLITQDPKRKEIAGAAPLAYGDYPAAIAQVTAKIAAETRASRVPNALLAERRRLNQAWADAGRKLTAKDFAALR